MCSSNPISTLTSLAIAPLFSQAGIAANQALKAVMPKIPDLPQSASQEGSRPPASQAAQAPDEAARRRAAGAGLASSGTMLTGPGGVAPNLLSLGKNTLLGA